MKGKWLTGALVLAMAAVTLAGCGAKDETKEKVEQVTLNEVAHSIFYAPQYVAIEEGYFADEGIDLTLITGFGADKVLTAMISGEADIGFMGAEATVYAYLEGTADPVVNFAQLTQRAGNFVVGREKDNSFTWEKLKNKEVLGGRKGGMPEMVFEYVLAQKGIEGRRLCRGIGRNGIRVCAVYVVQRQTELSENARRNRRKIHEGTAEGNGLRADAHTGGDCRSDCAAVCRNRAGNHHRDRAPLL
mgnify:CR=1 FL=1